jgi:hypothetical protein
MLEPTITVVNDWVLMLGTDLHCMALEEESVYAIAADRTLENAARSPEPGLRPVRYVKPTSGSSTVSTA